MKKGIMNCQINIKTSEAGTEISMEGSLPAMECALHDCIKQLAEHQGMTFADYCDKMKKVDAEVQDIKKHPMKLLEKLLGGFIDDEDEKSEFEEMLQNMMNGGAK